MSNLNEQQQQAVNYNDGPLLIIAGAGTGKTTVLVEKVKHLILEKKVNAESILALTFTEKAAAEMEERVDQALPYGYFQTWISTFHSFADQILRAEISHIGLDPGYKLLSEAETITFLKNNLFLFNLKYFRPLGNPNKFLHALIQHFSRLRDEDISPKEYKKWVDTLIPTRHPEPDEGSKKRSKKEKPEGITQEEIEKYKELAEAYETYQNLKIKSGYFDFADLIFYLVELFRKRQSILKKYQEQFKYILVDEFQDTNIAQYNLLKMLSTPENVIARTDLTGRSNPSTNNPKVKFNGIASPDKGLAMTNKTTNYLTVVGDDSQAIYKFRGASVSNILQFMHDYPKAESVTLNINYRSIQPILDVSYTAIKHNDPDTLETKLGISKKLISNSKAKGKELKDPIKFYFAESSDREADFVVSEIQRLMKESSDQLPTTNDHQPLTYSDFAILVRANKQSDAFINSLVRNGIPYRFWGPGMLFKQPEIKDLIAYLKVLSDIGDSASFYRILCMDTYQMDQQDISNLLSYAKRASLPLFAASEICTSFFHKEWFRDEYENYRKYLPLLSETTREKLITIVSMMKRHISLIKKNTAGQILYYFLEDTGLLKRMTTVNSTADEKFVNNISKFFTKLKAFESEYEDASVYAVVDYIQMSMELGESPITADNEKPEYDAVNILTTHAAKGLEFPVVFIVNLSQGRFPTTEKKESIPIPQEMIKETLPEGNYHLLEERRLFYVALTRAKNKLYLSAAKRYGDGKRDRKISPFVVEALGEKEVEKQLSMKQEEKQQLSIFDFKPTDIAPHSPSVVLSETKDPVTNKTNLKNFSFSQLESFALCPLQYKYQYILKIPTSQSAAASFGDSVHRSFQRFYLDFMNDQTIGIDHLIDVYHKVWIPIGYASPAHQNRMKKEGEAMLRRYFETFHHEHVSVIGLEKLFKIKIDDEIFVTGKIDRIDNKSDGEIEIIDYKTGKKPDEKKLEKSLQLSIYAIAATDLPAGALAKEGPFSVDKVNLTFYYLQDMEKISMKRTKEELITVKTEIIESVEKIRENKFPPKVGPWCEFCSFRIICEAW